MSLAAIGAGASGVGTGAQGLTNALGDLFGTSGSSATSGTGTSQSTSTESGTFVEQLDISDAGVQQILQDMLASEEGLASIFSEENVAGIFDSSVSAQASGSLLTKLAGEIAKLTAAKTQTIGKTAETTGASTEQSTSSQKKDGLLDDVKGALTFGIF